MQLLSEAPVPLLQYNHSRCVPNIILHSCIVYQAQLKNKGISLCDEKCIAPVKMKIAYYVAETQVLRLAAIASLMATLRARRLRSSESDTTFTGAAS